jgi:hypothetical protein
MTNPWLFSQEKYIARFGSTDVAASTLDETIATLPRVKYSANTLIGLTNSDANGQRWKAQSIEPAENHEAPVREYLNREVL